MAALLVAVTALCAWLGLIGNKAHRQKEAVTVVQRLDGVHLFNYHLLDPDGDIDGPIDLGRPPTAPVWARERIGEEYFRTLIGIAVDADGMSPTEADLGVICGLRDLKLLFIKQPRITDTDVARISTLSRLQVLRLDSAAVTDEGLRVLVGLSRLSTLSLRQTRVTDAGSRYLPNFPSLRRLNLSGTAITNDSLANLMPLRLLEELSLAETRVDDRALPHLLRLEGLQELDLWKTAVTWGTVRQLQAALPQCEIRWGG